MSLMYSNRGAPVFVPKEEKETSSTRLIMEAGKAGYTALSTYDKWLNSKASNAFKFNKDVFLNPNTSKYESVFLPDTGDKGVVPNMLRKVDERARLHPYLKDNPEEVFKLAKDKKLDINSFNENQLEVLGKHSKYLPSSPTDSLELKALKEGWNTPLKEGKDFLSGTTASTGSYIDGIPTDMAHELTSGTQVAGKSGLFSKFGTGEGTLANLGKGGQATTWGAQFGTGAGKISQVAKGVGAIGKGGIKSLFAAGTPATAGAAATAPGALAMGPAGWTMMALSLLGGKLFDKKTFLGKLFG